MLLVLLWQWATATVTCVGGDGCQEVRVREVQAHAKIHVKIRVAHETLRHRGDFESNYHRYESHQREPAASESHN